MSKFNTNIDTQYMNVNLLEVHILLQRKTHLEIAA